MAFRIFKFILQKNQLFKLNYNFLYLNKGLTYKICRQLASI
jgi:hypothetical protein